MSETNIGEKRELAERVAEAVLTRMPFKVISSKGTGFGNTLEHPLGRLSSHDTISLVTISMDSVYPAYHGKSVAIDVQSLFQARRALKVMFGWKIDKQSTKHSKLIDGTKSRSECELQADGFIKKCCQASGGIVNDLKRILSEFYKLRKEFGWDENKLTAARNALEVVEAVEKMEKMDLAEREAEDALVSASLLENSSTMAEF